MRSSIAREITAASELESDETGSVAERLCVIGKVGFEGREEDGRSAGAAPPSFALVFDHSAKEMVFMAELFGLEAM